jgi:hypothetical protein
MHSQGTILQIIVLPGCDHIKLLVRAPIAQFQRDRDQILVEVASSQINEYVGGRGFRSGKFGGTD